MEKVKEKAIQLLLDIISKEDFEMILYEKVETQDLIKNKLLFDLVNINYRNDNFKVKLSEIIEHYLPNEVIIINKIYYYSNSISNENKLNKIYKNFDKIIQLFDFENDYSLLWNFYSIQSRFDLVEIHWENEEEVIKDLKILCKKVCRNFLKLNSIEEKVNFLVDGFNEEIKTEPVEGVKPKKVELPTKTIKSKKWYEFWK